MSKAFDNELRAAEWDQCRDWRLAWAARSGPPLLVFNTIQTPVSPKLQDISKLDSYNFVEYIDKFDMLYVSILKVQGIWRIIKMWEVFKIDS